MRTSPVSEVSPEYGRDCVFLSGSPSRGTVKSIFPSRRSILFRGADRLRVEEECYFNLETVSKSGLSRAKVYLKRPEDEL